MKQKLTFRLAGQSDKAALFRFMDENWGEAHPLLHDEKFFRYYYENETGLNFAFAEDENGDIKAAAGYIACNKACSDIWISLWCTKKEKGAQGAGLQLMGHMAALTGADFISCNNIRPETMVFYDFLGYTTGRIRHYYRVRQGCTDFRLAKNPVLPDAAAKSTLLFEVCRSAAQLNSLCLPEQILPHKDSWYLERRFLSYPYENGYTLYLGREAADAAPTLAVAIQTVLVPEAGTTVLRLVDYVGQPEDFGRLSGFLDQLLTDSGAEYLDCYAFGLSEELCADAGLTERTANSDTIIPNYLTPPLYENTEYYCFTSQPENFLLFKADGDQNRPVFLNQ